MIPKNENTASVTASKGILVTGLTQMCFVRSWLKTRPLLTKNIVKSGITRDQDSRRST